MTRPKKDQIRMVHTIGHSTHDIDRFIALLWMHQINAVGDVRSQPYSRYQPHFNQDVLKRELKNSGISYVFLGEELGARSDDPKCYIGDQVSYAKLAQTPVFQGGLDRIASGIKSHNLALMCAEKEPLECHRTILIARYLEQRGLTVAHILADGTIEAHKDSIARLIEDLKISKTPDMFNPASPDEQGYAEQEKKIAYRRNHDNATDGSP